MQVVIREFHCNVTGSAKSGTTLDWMIATAGRVGHTISELSLGLISRMSYTLLDEGYSFYILQIKYM